MKKLKILIPVDSSERSYNSLNLLKNMYNKEQVEVTLMNVTEVMVSNIFLIQQQIKRVKKISDRVIKEAEKEIKKCNYDYQICSCFGKPSDKIIKKAGEDNFDMIIMAKSDKKGLEKIMGSVTSQVVRNSKVPVIVV